MRSFVALFLAGLLAAPLSAQHTILVTSNADGNPCDDDTFVPCLTDNGRFLTVSTDATDLVDDDATDNSEPVVVDLKSGKRFRAAVNDAGEPANDDSQGWGTSANGRFVAFDSYADNLVPNDGNFSRDVFVRDLKKGLTRRVSISSEGVEGNSASDSPRISANGRFVVFRSNATNMVPGDTIESHEIFVHDLKTGLTERASVPSSGAETAEESERPTISANGRWVAFISSAEDMVADDDNGKPDVFVRDRKLGTTTRVSVTEAGGQVTGTFGAGAAFLSGNGRYVAMATDMVGLDLLDQNGVTDIYVRDLKLGTLRLITRGFDGADADAASGTVSDSLGISGNGRWIVFGSDATNLVETGGSAPFDDVFLADRAKGTLVLVSEGLAGAPVDGNANECSVSNNGKRVAYSSTASNLVETPAPGPAASRDVYVRNLKK